MPYILRKIKNGYKVCKKNEPKKCFSKKPLTKETATKQMYAIQSNENMEGSGTHRTNILKKYDLEDKGYSLEELAEITETPIDTLQEVYNRGIGAYKTNPTSVRMKGSYKKNVKAPMSKKLSKEQWAMARVYSFLDGNPNHDDDLREELEGGLKPLTARIGGKVLLKKKIVNNFFPEISTYKTYVEPFVGAGAVYFYKNKDDKKEVINDIDPKLYEIFKGFQKYDAKKLREDLNGDYTESDFKKIKESTPTKEYNKFLKTYLLFRLSYFGLGLTFGKPRINSKFEDYKERLENVTILNEDFQKVIQKYNNKDTFFYLDPPVANSSSNYKYNAIDVYDLIPLLKSIKGLFCLSYANTSIKKELFKGFKVFTVDTNYVGEKSKGGQSKKVKEYIITNYDPIKKTMTGGCATCGLEGSGVGKLVNINPEYDLDDSYQRVRRRAMMELREILEKQMEHISKSDLHKVSQYFGLRSGKRESSEEYSNRGFINEEYVKNIINFLLQDGEVFFSSSNVNDKDYYNYEDLKTTQNNNVLQYFNIIGKDVPHSVVALLEKQPAILPKQKKSNMDVDEGRGKPSEKCSGCMGKCGKGMVRFHKQLEKVGLNHDKYMKQVKHLAKGTGYDPSKVEMSMDEDHKCVYHSPDGDVYFGKVGYGDFIIYSWLEQQGEEEEGFAEMKRNAYLKRATNIKGNWKDNKYSPNNLAINILWAGNI